MSENYETLKAQSDAIVARQRQKLVDEIRAEILNSPAMKQLATAARMYQSAHNCCCDICKDLDDAIDALRAKLTPAPEAGQKEEMNG